MQQYGRQPPDAVQSFLILPFATTGSGVDGIDLGSTLSDDLRDQLGAVQNLRVIGRRTALRTQITHESYADMARKWAVDAVLEGNVDTAGNDVEARLKLVNATTGGVIFQKVYRATFNDMPALTGQLADDIAQALHVRFPRGQDSAAHLPRTEAYRLYLQGRYYSMQNTPGGFQQAHDYFEQATKIDAQFAGAWVALAVTDMLRVDFGGRSPARPRPQPSRHWRGHNSSIPARQNCWPCAVSWRSTTATTRRRPMRCARQPPCVPATVKLTCGWDGYSWHRVKCGARHPCCNVLTIWIPILRSRH